MSLIQKRKVNTGPELSKYLGLGLNMSNPLGYGLHVNEDDPPTLQTRIAVELRRAERR
jgi:hypothetical protein